MKRRAGNRRQSRKAARFFVYLLTLLALALIAVSDAAAQTAQLEVRKVLSPSSDPGRFDLQIDGVTEKSNAGNGETTGPKAVTPDYHQVGEIAHTGTSLGDYQSAITCRDQDGAGPIVALNYDVALSFYVPDGADIVCTIANGRKVDLTSITTDFNTPVGIDYHQPSNSVVVSVNYATGGEPYNFELIDVDGSHSPFSTAHGLSDEVKIASVRPGACQGGFSAGELFTGTGVPGEIARISADGSNVQDPWVTLPNESGLMRGSLFQDRYCVFNGDLIAVTTNGGVWRVSSAGIPTKLADIPTHLEGLTTVPNDSVTYGPWAGKILAGAEQQTRLYTIASDGTVEPYELGIQPEDIDIIPSSENFFGVEYGGGRILGAPATQFAGRVGHLQIAQESPGLLWDVRWRNDTNSFDVVPIAQTSQWEHVTFAPTGVCEVSGSTGPPVACAGKASTPQDTPVEITMVAHDPDGSSLTYSIVGQPSHGSLGPISGDKVTYTPNPAYNGPDSFTFRANDGTSNSNTAKISITVGPPPGTIIVRKDAVPDSPQDFSFTAGGGLSPTSFVLDDDPGGTVADQKVFSGVTPGGGTGPGGTYSISETAVAAWEGSGTCDDGSSPSAIDVSSGETIVCTFVNYQRGYARPKSATPLNFKLVPAFEPCISPNTTHDGPPSSASCRPPAQSSSHLTLNSPDRVAPYNTTANGFGTLVLKVTCLTPGTTTETGQTPPCPATGDQADVKITSSMGDVRCVAVSGGCSAAGGTYGGKLLGLMTLRSTDRRNGAAQSSAGTVVDTPFTWGVQCSAGSCSSTTSGDAVMPGLVPEQKRAIYELSQLEVRDGGTNGNLAAASSPSSGTCLPACTGDDDETVFLRPGFFSP